MLCHRQSPPPPPPPVISRTSRHSSASWVLKNERRPVGLKSCRRTGGDGAEELARE